MKKIVCLLAAVVILCASVVPASAATIEYPSWEYLKAIVAELPTSKNDVEFDSFFICLAENGSYSDGTFKINCILWNSEYTNFYWKSGVKYDWTDGAYLLEVFWDKYGNPPTWKQYSSVDQAASDAKLLYASRDIYDKDGVNLITPAGVGPVYKEFLETYDPTYTPGAMLPNPGGGPLSFNEGLNSFWAVIGSVIAALPEDVLLTISWLFAAFMIIGGIKLFN